MISAIIMSVEVISCFPFVKVDMKGETKKFISLGVTSLNCWRKWLRIINVIAKVLIHKRSTMDISTESFLTVAQIGVVIFMQSTHCLQELDSVPSVWTWKSFYWEVLTMGKILPQLLLSPLFLCCHQHCHHHLCCFITQTMDHFLTPLSWSGLWPDLEVVIRWTAAFI